MRLYSPDGHWGQKFIPLSCLVRRHGASPRRTAYTRDRHGAPWTGADRQGGASHSGVPVPNIFVAGLPALVHKQASGHGARCTRSSLQQGDFQNINQLRRRSTWAKRLDTSHPIARSTAHTHSRACPSFTASSSPPRMDILHDSKRRPPLLFCGRGTETDCFGRTY